MSFDHLVLQLIELEEPGDRIHPCRRRVFYLPDERR